MKKGRSITTLLPRRNCLLRFLPVPAGSSRESEGVPLEVVAPLRGVRAVPAGVDHDPFFWRRGTLGVPGSVTGGEGSRRGKEREDPVERVVLRGFVECGRRMD